jgi:hypothetical protein
MKSTRAIAFTLALAMNSLRMVEYADIVRSHPTISAYFYVLGRNA